ncbi:phospholipid phosphatase 1-like [Eucyclogobius newberryi]|uniref:phospholipid phosphatase 1-like n=1 Tax=Eucyclogobius newberryi TaxID=166745 RepID=UPI003B59D3D4
MNFDTFNGETCAPDRQRLVSPKPTRRTLTRNDSRRRIAFARAEQQQQPRAKRLRDMFEASGIPLVLLDVSSLVLVALPFLILTTQHYHFNRGFFCSDESIRYPLKEETISYQLLGGVLIPFSLIVVVCGECLSVYLSRIRNHSSGMRYVVCVYKAVGSYIFGAAASQSLTDLTKNSIGRLRPNFLAVCNPSWDKINCKTGVYIENFTCTGEPSLVDDARLSFYSGHSSFSMYCMMFLVLYIQARLKSNWTRLLRPTFQFFLIAAALYVGLSRVSDYKHHWSDVLTGLLLGGLVAILNVVCVTNFFEQPIDRAVSQEEEAASHTSLQENPARENHYGSTE